MWHFLVSSLFSRTLSSRRLKSEAGMIQGAVVAIGLAGAVAAGTALFLAQNENAAALSARIALDAAAYNASTRDFLATAVTADLENAANAGALLAYKLTNYSSPLPDNSEACFGIVGLVRNPDLSFSTTLVVANSFLACTARLNQADVVDGVTALGREGKYAVAAFIGKYESMAPAISPLRNTPSLVTAATTNPASPCSSGGIPIACGGHAEFEISGREALLGSVPAFPEVPGEPI